MVVHSACCDQTSDRGRLEGEENRVHHAVDLRGGWMPWSFFACNVIIAATGVIGAVPRPPPRGMLQWAVIPPSFLPTPPTSPRRPSSSWRFGRASAHLTGRFRSLRFDYSSPAHSLDGASVAMETAGWPCGHLALSAFGRLSVGPGGIWTMSATTKWPLRVN